MYQTGFALLGMIFTVCIYHRSYTNCDGLQHTDLPGIMLKYVNKYSKMNELDACENVKGVWAKGHA